MTRIVWLLIGLSFSFTQLAFANHLFFSNEKAAYYTSDFYFLLDNEASSSDIKHELNRILTMAHNISDSENDVLTERCHTMNCFQHKKYSYKEARRYMFGKLHLQEDDDGYYVKDVYCKQKFNKHNVNPYPPAPDTIPNHEFINAEHTWPQSWFGNGDKSYKKVDLHSLFPSNSRANSSRSNHPFGNVDEGRSNNVCKASKRGRSSNLGRTVFEPPQSHKGNVARAMFYFATRYSMSIKAEQEKILREWHTLDPVDENEELRNQSVYDFQYTRNPFIDFPELVSKIEDF